MSFFDYVLERRFTIIKKWKNPSHVHAACVEHVKDLLASLTRDANKQVLSAETLKELADFAIIAELAGVTPTLMEERRNRFQATAHLPALGAKSVKDDQACR